MNSELYNKTYSIPDPIINRLEVLIMNSGDSEGIKRAKFIVKNRACTYQMLKGLKSFFDHYDVHKNTPEQYELSGGELMKRWVDTTLTNERKRTSISSKNRQGLDAKKTTGTNTLGAQSGGVNMSTKISEGVETEDNPIMDDGINDGVSDGVNDGVNDGVKQNAIAVIYNQDGKVLLVKRSPETEQWMPDKWALVGGGVEIGEQPEDAVKREVFEETGLELDNFNRSFGVETKPKSMLHVFTAYYDGDIYNVRLNDEHTAFGWYSIPEMEYIDAVPNLVLYVSNALTGINR